MHLLVISLAQEKCETNVRHGFEGFFALSFSLIMVGCLALIGDATIKLYVYTQRKVLLILSTVIVPASIVVFSEVLVLGGFLCRRSNNVRNLLTP